MKAAKCFSEKSFLRIRYQRLVIVQRGTIQNLPRCTIFISKFKFLETNRFKIFFSIKFYSKSDSLEKVWCKIMFLKRARELRFLSFLRCQLGQNVIFFKIFFVQNQIFWKSFQIKIQDFEKNFRLWFSKSKNK